MLTMILVATLLNVGAPGAVLHGDASDEAYQELTLESAILYDGGDGHIWVGRPVISLGMYGVQDLPPIRLGPQVHQQLAPLVTGLEAPPADRDLYWHHTLPQARGDDPLTLVRLNVKCRKVSDDSTRAASRAWRLSEVYEVVEAHVVTVEFVTRDWHDAWDRATDRLKEIVSISRTANPGDDKKRQISAAVDKAAQALEAMYKAQVGDEWLARAREAALADRVVHLFQRHVREEWQRELENYASVLRVPISKALPARTPPFDPVKLLAESDSPEEFVSKANASWPEDALVARLIYSPSLKRSVYVREVSELSPSQFSTLRAEAREQIAERNRPIPASAPAGEPQTRTIDELHAIVGPADPDLLAAKLVLAGLVVDQVTDHEPGLDLKPGDLILDYETTNDVAMGAGDLKRSASWLANKARYGGVLQVLRGNQLMTVELPKGRRP